MTATANGYGKLTPLEEQPGAGPRRSRRHLYSDVGAHGRVVGALQGLAEDELMLITSAGTLVRTPFADISTMGRNTQGVRLIRLDENDRLVGVSRVEAVPGEENLRRTGYGDPAMSDTQFQPRSGDAAGTVLRRAQAELLDWNAAASHDRQRRLSSSSAAEHAQPARLLTAIYKVLF